LCDTHCHLYLDEFSQDLESVLDRAAKTRVTKILVPGIDVDTSIRAIELSNRYPRTIYAAVGIHPNYSNGIGQGEISKIEELLRNNKGIRAIGEIGLDYYRTWSSRDDQVFVLKGMLSLAEQFNLPVCLHVREAVEDLLVILEEWYSDLQKHNHPLAQRPGVFHSFEGSPPLAAWAAERCFKLGISGTVTYPKAQGLRASLVNNRLDNLILETDAPYLSPQPQRGKRNEPSYVKYIAEEISRTLETDIDQVIEVTSQNAGKLFAWEPD